MMLMLQMKRVTGYERVEQTFEQQSVRLRCYAVLWSHVANRLVQAFVRGHLMYACNVSHYQTCMIWMYSWHLDQSEDY